MKKFLREDIKNLLKKLGEEYFVSAKYSSMPLSCVIKNTKYLFDFQVYSYRDNFPNGYEVIYTINWFKFPYIIDYVPDAKESSKVVKFIKKTNLEDFLSDKEVPSDIKKIIIFDLDKFQ